VLNRPSDKPYVFIPNLNQKVQSATTIKDKKAVRMKQYGEGTFVYLDGIPADGPDTVLVLQLQ
jgi:alpha-L-fucosidase